MDIFDRISAAIALILAGVKKDFSELRDHIDAIDTHLDGDSAHNNAVEDHLAINEDVPDDAGHVDVIHAGLQKIIDATQSSDTDAGNTADTPAVTSPSGGDTAAADAPAPAAVTTAPTVTPAAS